MNKNIPLAIRGTVGALTAVLALSFPLVANAEGFNASGFYIDLGLGQAKADLGNTSGWNVNDTDTSYSIGAGYKFNDNIAIEGGYMKLGTASASITGTVTSGVYSGSTGTISGSAEVTGYYFGPMFSLPMGDKFEAYARAGVYLWDEDIKASATGTLVYNGTAQGVNISTTKNNDGNDAYYGIGIAYKANKNVSVGADWTRYTADKTDVDVIGARLKYAF